VRDPHLILVAALVGERRACELCKAAAPSYPHGVHFKATGRRRKHKREYLRARAYHHPNPLRSKIILWRCERHATVGQVPMNPKAGLGGGVYR
jgi:hypothetical protein